MITYIFQDRIKQKVCALKGISIRDFEGKCREREIVDARKLFCLFMCTHSNLTLKAIGDAIGQRDHTTVMHNRDTAKNLIKTDTHFCKLWQELISIIPVAFTAMSYKPRSYSA